MAPDLNFFALTLVQAMLGQISPNIRRVTISVDGEKLRVEWVLESEKEDDRDAIEDVFGDFSASTWPDTTEAIFETIITSEELRAPSPEEKKIVVYWRRE
jgi:hypothetical protein